MKQASSSQFQNFAHLTALFVVMIVSLTVMGAGCSAEQHLEVDANVPAMKVEVGADGDAMASSSDQTSGAMPATTTSNPVMEKTPVVDVKLNVGISAGSPAYKDGTYSATGKYNSPAGAEELDVTLTLKKDIVVDAKVTEKAVNKISIRMQDQFAAGYKQYVIGKNIKDIQITKVSGSSLTPEGFNDAVAKIKVQAAL
jgi:hypothetical protein